MNESTVVTGGTRRAMTGSIHRIREFELEKVCLVEEFDILQIVGEGWFGKILLVEHRATDTEMVLKALPKPYVSIRDFYREFHYGLHLSAHRNIVTTYDVAFETAGFYVFSQEYAPLGDLTSNIVDTGIGELHSKRLAKQLAAALEHIHNRELVHRDVKLDNILVYRSDFSRIKLCDFGETRKVNSNVRRRNEWLPYSAPEVLKLPIDSTYRAQVSHDVWQFGIVIFICLTGCLPWQKAAFDDPRYLSYFNWYNSANPLKKQPKLFKMVSSKAQKMFKKFIEPRIERRATNFNELSRFMEDRWMAKGFTDRVAGSDIDELCPSMYSFHSDVNEKNILLKHFLEHGIETTVDRQAKKERIRDWIQNSVILEETEEETVADDILGGEEDPVDELCGYRPGDDKHPKTTLRYDHEKHINPRTGEVIDRLAQVNDGQHLSFDAQNIEPVAPANVSRRVVKQDEGTNSQSSSNKDSAYGSIELKGTNNTRSSSIENQDKIISLDPSPSRSLSQTSIPQPKSPLPKHLQNFNKTLKSDNSGEDGAISRSSRRKTIDYNTNAVDELLDNGMMENKTATLVKPKLINRHSPDHHPSEPDESRPQYIITNNQINYEHNLINKHFYNVAQKERYKSMKHTAYDVAPKRDFAKDDNSPAVDESPYTSMMNIVQGNIQFTPYSPAGVRTNENVVNVTITPLKRSSITN